MPDASFNEGSKGIERSLLKTFDGTGGQKGKAASV